MNLRRFVPVALVVAVLVPLPAAASHDAPTTTHYAVDRFSADWILSSDEKGEFKYFVVSVTRRTNLDTGKEKLSGAVGRGSCVEGADGFACGSMSDSYNVVDFDADRALTSMRVVLRRGRLRHTVQFSATTPFARVPPVGDEPNLCGGRTKVVYLSGRSATAEGRVFGRHVSTADEYEPQRTPEIIVQTLEIEECA